MLAIMALGLIMGNGVVLQESSAKVKEACGKVEQECLALCDGLKKLNLAQLALT